MDSRYGHFAIVPYGWAVWQHRWHEPGSRRGFVSNEAWPIALRRRQHSYADGLGGGWRVEVPSPCTQPVVCLISRLPRL